MTSFFLISLGFQIFLQIPSENKTQQRSFLKEKYILVLYFKKSKNFFILFILFNPTANE